MYEHVRLSNSLDVLVSPMRHMSSVSIGVWIRVGGRHERKQESGISHFIEHMLFKGTETRDARALKEEIEGVGGSFNGFTADEVTCYMVKVPAEHLELGASVLMDMVNSPKFDEVEIEKEKHVIFEEIKMYKDQPSEYVLEMLEGIMWPDNPLGRPLTGTISTVKGLTRDKLIKFKKDNYYPGNMGVVASGKTTAKKLASYIKSDVKNYGPGKKQIPEKASYRQNKAVLKVLNRNINQSHIAMGFRDPVSSEKEKFAAKIMNVILGGNMSSRLFEELREKRGLCYDISSSYKRHSDIGEMDIHAGVDSTKTYRSVNAILDELKRLKDQGVSADELTRAKEYAKGQFELAMEGTSPRMLWMGERYMVHGKIPGQEDVIKKIDRVTRTDISKAADRLFRSRGLNLAIVGKISSYEKEKIRKSISWGL